jgi:hypothetical protein
LKTKPAVRSHEYKNDFLYIVIRQTPEQGPRTWLYCCGINTSRFDPLCWGKAGICSNPAFKGLQLLRADVVAFALKKDLKPSPADGGGCGPITPRNDGWYRENLVIGGASPKDAAEILKFSVTDLLKTVLIVCAPEAVIPKELPTPRKLQTWLEALGAAKP